METPDLSHLGSKDFTKIYEPAEDTFLLIDSIEKDLELIKLKRPLICLEIGSGAGAVITSVAKALGENNIFISTDINPYAATATSKTANYNGVHVEAIVTDLATCLDRLYQKVDLLIFNPPYVVTPPDEINSSLLHSSWAGGIKGRQVMDRFFADVSKLLSKEGLFYLLIIKENDKDDIGRKMAAHGLQMTEVMTRRCGIEHLSVLRFSPMIL